MSHIFRNYRRQKFEPKEMIVVLNKNDMDIDKWRAKAKQYSNVRICRVDEKNQLGKCLNVGIAKAKYDIIAKFDDDDYYAPGYLKEMVDALRSNKRASIVGKHTSYVYFEERKALMLYREGGELKYENKVKGGTLVFKRSVWERVKFDEDRLHGSDAHFLRDCRKVGFRIYSTSRYNYVCKRREDIGSHTQKTSTEDYMARCKLIARTDDYVPVISRTF